MYLIEPILYIFFFFLDYWAPVLQQTFYSCLTPYLYNLVAVLDFWLEMKMFILLLVPMTSC